MHVGFLFAWEDWGDALWNQCDEPGGRHAHLRFSGVRSAPARPGRAAMPAAGTGAAATATGGPHDRIVCWSIPYLADPAARLRGWRRRLAKWRGGLEAARHAHAWARVPLGPDRVDVMMYEPPEAVSDAAYAFVAARAGRVWGPDPRAGNPVMLPSVFTFGGSLPMWRDLPPPRDHDKVLPLVAVTSAASSLPGHAARAGFYAALQRAGLPLTLHGRGLGDRGAGSLTCKSHALLAARYCLAIENSCADDRYVSEKLWDALVAWCVPLYFGTRALENIIPAESFIRIPSLDAAGVEVVAAALADPGQYRRRLAAIAEARRLALGPLRMVEFLARNIPKVGP